MSTSHHRFTCAVAVGGWRTVFALGCLFGALVGGHAQSPGETNAASPPSELKLTGGGAVAARALANQANNPTAPLTLVQFRDVYVPKVPGYDSGANVMQIDPVFPIFASPLIPFEQLMKLTLQVPTTPRPGSQTGFGDTAIFDLVSIKQSWGRWGFGPAMVFPTASSSQLGQGKWQAGPAVALIYTGIENLTAGAVVPSPAIPAGRPSTR